MPVITVVRTSGCHYCEDAAAALAELAAEHPLQIEFLDATDSRGADLVASHRVPMFPLVLVDGQFFSYGRLPRRKLTALLRNGLKAATR